MKKVFFITLIILGVVFMGSCNNNQSNGSKPTGEYKLISPNDYNLNVKVGEGAIEKDFVIDAKTAQTIGDAIIMSIVGDEFKDLIDVTVSFDQENGIWIVNRGLGGTNLGGDYSCAIQKSDGKILKVWAGE